MPSDLPADRVLAIRRVIGEHIREARLHANLTQEVLALRIGIDRSSIIEIEQGRRNMTINTFIRIADAVGVPLADLVR